MPDVMRTQWGLVLVVVAPLAGCFYVDPINERPGADIHRVTPTLPLRGDLIEVEAYIYDPDGDGTTADWRAHACNLDGCDGLAFDTSSDQYAFEFAAPLTRTDGTPTTYIQVELEVTDSLGARSAPRQSVVINVDNNDPELPPPRRVGREFRGAFPVGTPVEVIVEASDPDDLAETLVYGAPVLYPPQGATLEDATLSDATVETLSNRLAASWTLVADAVGNWEMVIEVADPLGGSSMREITIPYAPDHPPCIAVAEPAFPPAGARIIVDEPRRFAVLTIDDDLDVYPPPAVNDPLLDAASFRWFLASPASGGAPVPLAIDGNAVELDPDAFAPGDQLELRVEAVDRVDRALCDGGSATCELAAACVQRQTWSLEVR